MLSAADKDEGKGLIASILPISGLEDVGALKYYDASDAWSNRHPIAITNASDVDIEITEHTSGPQVTFEFRDSSGSTYVAEEPFHHGTGVFRKYRIAPDESVLIHAQLNINKIPGDLLRKLEGGVNVFEVRVTFNWAGRSVKSDWRKANVYKDR